MAGGNRRTDDRLVPYVMFTDPPLARVGLSEGEAQRNGIPVRVARLPMSNVLRTAATDENQGFMKVMVSANDYLILGFTMIGSKPVRSWLRSKPRCSPSFLTRSCVTPSSRTSRSPKVWALFSAMCRRERRELIVGKTGQLCHPPALRVAPNARTSQSMNTRTRGDNCRLRGYSNETGVGEGGQSGSTATSVPRFRSSST
jgi:hypothetical protein